MAGIQSFPFCHPRIPHIRSEQELAMGGLNTPLRSTTVDGVLFIPYDVVTRPMNPLLDEDTDPKLRDQILKYHLSGVMTDRERARMLGLPDGCRIRENAKIICPEKLVCGKNVWIGEGAVLDASGGLEIGDSTQIGLYTLIWSHTSHAVAMAGETCVSNEKIVRKPTKIGKNCFIGGPSVIYPGVKIGDRVTVLPMSAITKDVPDRAVVGGTSIDKTRVLEEKIAALQARLDALEKKG